MATEGVAAEVAPEKPVQEETGAAPLKLEKELSGNLTDSSVSEIDDKKVDLSDGTKIGDVVNIDCGALIRTANQSISEDPSGDSKSVQSIYLGNSGCSEGEDFTKSPLNIQVSLDEKISKCLNAGLDEGKPFEIGKEMVKSDTSCQNDNIGKMEKKDESTEREHYSEANEKDTCDATLARQRTGEWSSEREKEAKVQYEEALELASKQRIMGNNVEEVPPLAVKGLDCLNLQKEELGNEIAFSKDNPEVEACNNLEVFEINIEASNRHIDQKCEKVVHESAFTAERLVKDEEKKLEAYSYVESEGIGHTVSETAKDEYDTAQENEAEVHTSIFNPPTLQESPSNTHKDELCSYETDKASDMDQKKNVNILAHDIAMKKKHEDCSLLDDGTEEKNTVSDVKEKNKKSDELQEEQNASENISDSMASHVANRPSVEKKKKDTEEETIQMDGAIQQTGTGEEGTNNGFKLNIFLCANDETTITKVDSKDEKIGDGLNLVSENKQPETIEANDKILKSDKDAGEGIQNVHHFVSKTEGHLHNSQCSTEVALQNDEGQKVEVKELSESLPDERIVASTAMSKTKDETTIDRTTLTADTPDETDQCDEIVDELQSTSQGREENEFVTVIHLTEVEHERAQEVSSTSCKEVDVSTVEEKKKQSSSDIELYAQDISKTDKELDMETDKSQDRDLSEDHKLEDRNIIKSIDPERTKENTSVQGGETAESQEQSCDKNQEIITLDHDILNENTTDAIEFDTSSSAESTGEKCFLDKHQENEKTEAIPKIIHKKDKFYKEKDINEVDSMVDECKNLQGSDSHSEESLKQTGADCEPSRTKTQQDVGLNNIRSSARERVNEGVPKSNTERCKDTEEANLVACEQKDGDDQKHDNHPKTMSLGDEAAEEHTYTEKEHIYNYKQPSCSKQEEETGSDKHREETGELMTGCQESSKIENLGEQTKNIHAKEEMRYDWTIIEESKKANDLTEEDKTQEDDPDRSNALLPITYESVRKTMEEEEDIMQKKVPGSDTQEAIHETTNTNMTIGTGCENDAKSPVQPQPTFERTEEDESISDGPLKEQSEPETDQEASSTVSKYVGRITDEDAQKKASPETELCAQDTSEDDREVTVQDDEISVPSEHLPFNEDITTLVGDEVLKVATDRKFETSVQSPEDECLLNESQEKEKVAATSEMIQEEDKSHKVMNLYEVDSHEKKCNMLPKDPQAEESSENIGPDYEQFQTDTQEDCELTIIESSERRALKSNAEHKEHIEGKDEGNSKADILIDETDRQMLDNHQEHLSLGDDAAGGGMYTEREHIYKEPKCSEVLEIISQECKGEGDKLEEEAGKQTLNNHERSKQDNSSEETKNSLTEDTKEVTVPKQDNKRADDVKVTNEGPMDDSNAHLNVTNESVEEVVKQTLNHQESAKQDNLSEETKNALTEDTKEDTVSEPENKETEDLKETYEKHMDDSNADLSVTNELVEKAVKQTLDNQESSKHDNWSEEAKNALTEETKEVKVPEMTKRTDNLKETNEEYTEVSNAHLSVTNESVEEAVKETLGNQESSKQDNLSEETKTALTKETKEVSVPNQENNRTDDLKETNEEYMDESDAHLSVTDELVEEAVKQTLDHPESSKEDKLSEKTKKEFTEDTKEVTDPEQENKRTDDIKLTNVKHMDGSSAHLNVTDEQVEEEGKQTLDNKESSKKDILSEETQNALIEETKVVTVSEQENKRTDDLMETKEEHTDESDDPLSVTNELDEEAIKQTLDNQESSKQGKLSEETQNVLPEETKEVTDPEQETKRTDDLKETNEEYTDESIAHLSVTDELVEEAVKQTLDNQESSEQDNLSRETKNALTEETKEVTVPVQENKSTDDLKEANEEHMDERDAHLDVTNELVGEAVKQTLNNQESSKQVNLSEETENELIEESKEVTVPKQQNMSTDDLKETNVHTDERNTHLNATDELVREAVKQTLDNQENCKQDNLSEETDDAPIEETKEVIVPKQENKRTDDIKVTIEEHMDGNNAHLNVINELVEVAGKQALDNQETSKQDNLSGETKNAHTEQTNVVIIPEQENKGTSDLKETNEEHMDLSTAHLCVTDELVEEADKQTLDNEENSKQDILCEETKNTFTEESKEVTVPEQKHKGIDDLKETNEEHTDEGNFVTDELLEEAIKQTPNNQESSKQDNLSEETKNALTKETKEVTASEQERKRTNDLKETSEEHTDESNPCLSVTNELVEDLVKQKLNNHKSSKQHDLSEETQNALIGETKEVTVPEQETKRTDDLKETNEEHMDDSNAHLSVTNELAEEAVKQTCDNQERPKQGNLSEETQNALAEKTKEVTDPKQETKRTDDLKETNEEYKDESIAHLSVTDELVEEAVKQTLDNQESSEQDNLRQETKNALTEETKEVTVPVQENKSIDDIKETNEEHMDESNDHLSVMDELVEEAVKQTLDKQGGSKQDNLSEEAKDALREETKEVTVIEQENKITDRIKVTNVENVDVSNAHLNVTDELVEEAGKQKLDNQESSKQDNSSTESNIAVTEETKEVTVQENKSTDDLKEASEEHMDKSIAHLMDGRVGRLRSESADSESGRPLATRLWGGNTDPPTGQSGLVYQADSGRLRPTQAESGPTQGRDRLGPTQPPDPTLPSLAHLDVIDELVGEAVKQTPNNQESSEQDNLSEESKNELIEETKKVTVPKQENMSTDDLKERNVSTDESNTHLNVTDELVGEAVKQALDNQESSKQDNLSEETKDAPTEETKEVTVPKQEKKRTDDIKVTTEEHMDGNNAHLNVIDELDEVAGKQTLDNQESTKRDNLSGETKNASTEQTKIVIIPEQENKGTNDLKETNDEHADESNAHLCVTDELVEEADRQTLDNEENSKQDILCEETKNAFTEERKEVTVPEQENKRTDDLKETNEEHTDEGNFVTGKLVEEAIKQTLDNQESSKQDNLSEETKNALTRETKEVTASEQENKRTDDLKETNEEHMDDSNAHLSVTNELLAEEAVKQTSDNQESSKQDELSEETKNACMEGIKELTIPEQNKKTDDLKEINEEHKDESNAHLTVIDELVEETLREADTMQKESGSNRKQVIHETMNNHVAVETKSFHAEGSQFCKDTVGYEEGNFKAVAQSDEDREHLPFVVVAASVETCTEKEDTSKELDFSKIAERNNQEEEEEANKLQEEANDAQSDKDHEPLSFGDAAVSGQTCTEKEDTSKELDCSKIVETNTQEEEEEADKLQEEANGQPPPEDQENIKLENLDREIENAHVKEEKYQDIVTLEQEKKRINYLKEECITDEENPDKSNAFSPETHEPAEKTQEEEDTMQKESPTSDTQKTVHETPDIHMTPSTRDENHEISLVELQATYRRTEEDESTSYSQLKEEDESSRDQEDSSTVSKEIGGNTDRATQSKTCPEDKLCSQEISKDNNEPDVQEDKTVLPREQLIFDKNQEIITSADVELQKEGTTDAEKYETSSPIQSTEEKCLLSEHQENEKLAVTAKIIQEKDQSHRDMELYEDSHAKKCDTLCVPDSQAERTSEKIGSEYEPSPTDPQEYDSLATTESSEREELNQGAPKSSTEESEHIADNEDENLKAVTQSDERDGQKLHNHHEPLSFEVNAVGNEEMGGSSSSQEISDDSSCLILSESGNNVYLKNHTEDISEKEASTKVHEVASTSEVTEEMLQDKENREKGQEEEETPQECEPTPNTAKEIPIAQIEESVSKQSRNTPDRMDSEESVKVTSLEMVGDDIKKSTEIPLGGPGLSHEAVSGVKQHTQVELGEARGQESRDEVDGIGTTTADSETSEDGGHELESCSVMKEQSIENTKKQKIEETELPEPYPVSNSLFENKEIRKTTDEVPSMNNHLPDDTDVSAEQTTSEEIDEELVASKETNKSSASDDISSAEISDEAKDIKMASANLLSTNVLDTANAKEESSNSVVLMSLGEAFRQEGHGKEQTQEFKLISSEKTKQNIISNEDNESNSKFLEYHDETVDLSEEIDTEGYRDKGQNKSPTAELPADGTTAAEVSNNFEKSYDSLIEVPKDEDTKDKLFQDIPSFTIAMEVGEATPDNRKEKQEMGIVRSILYNETTAGNVSLQTVEEFDNKSVTSSGKTESNEDRHGSISQEVHVLTASEVSNVMACNKDGIQLLDASILVFNKQTKKADSQEKTMREKQPELPPCKQLSGAEKFTTGEREVMKTTEDKSHDLANFETLQNDKDKGMDVSYLPVSQYLINRIMREEDEKTQIVVQEGIEDGHEGVDIMTKELDISSDKHERLEEFVSQNIDREPKSKVSSLPAMEISVEDTKKEVFWSENLIDTVPKDDEKRATTEKNKTQSELKNGEFMGLGPKTHEKSDGLVEVMEQRITLNDNKVLTKKPDSPTVAEIDSNMIPEEKCPKHVEAIEKQSNIQMLEEMEQKIILNDNKALTKNPDSPSVAEVDGNKIPQEENCPKYVEARGIQLNIQMLEEAIIEEHPPETMVTTEMKSFIGIHENLLKTQEPPRPILEVNQVLGDSLEFAADIKEVKIIENKHDGISDVQVEGSIGKTKLSHLGEAHPSDSEKDPINRNNQIAKSILEEKALATNRDELNKEVTDMQVGLDETKNFNGTDETPLKIQEPSTPVREVNQVVQDALDFAPAEKEIKAQTDDKTDGIGDAQMDSTVEEPNRRAKLSDKKHPSESEEDSIDDHIQIAEGTLEEKNLTINRDGLDKEPIHMQRDEDTGDEEVEKDVEEYEVDKSGADAPMTVETWDEEPKTAHKKPHNILSGVKSKVKHSIAKVKKAITGKSSHSKTAPTK